MEDKFFAIKLGDNLHCSKSELTCVYVGGEKKVFPVKKESVLVTSENNYGSEDFVDGEQYRVNYKTYAMSAMGLKRVVSPVLGDAGCKNPYEKPDKPATKELIIDPIDDIFNHVNSIASIKTTIEHTVDTDSAILNGGCDDVKEIKGTKSYLDSIEPEIIQLMNGGLNARDIADKLGTPYTSTWKRVSDIYKRDTNGGADTSEEKPNEKFVREDPKKGTRLSEDEVNMINFMDGQGYPVKEIANTIKRSPSAVSDTITGRNRTGNNTDPSKKMTYFTVTKEEDSLIMKYNKEGLTNTEIGVKLNRASSTINSAIKRMVRKGQV